MPIDTDNPKNNTPTATLLFNNSWLASLIKWVAAKYTKIWITAAAKPQIMKLNMPTECNMLDTKVISLSEGKKTALAANLTQDQIRTARDRADKWIQAQ